MGYPKDKGNSGSPERKGGIQMNRCEFVNENKTPKQVSVIIWDVNGTITFQEKLDDKVVQIIIETAKQGVLHVFITGRDRFWLGKFLVKPFKEKARSDTKDVFKNIKLCPELGLMSLDPVSEEPTIFEEIRSHPLVSSSVRERIATLFWQPHNLPPFNKEEQVPPRRYIGKDANGKPYLFPIIPDEIDIAVRLPDFIWSDTKELIGTAEVIRDREQEIPSKRGDKIQPAAKIVKDFLDYWEVKEITVSPVSTAINIAPILDGTILDKDWAAGRVLRDIEKITGKSIEEITQSSLAIGDGKADFLFSRPYLEKDRRTNIAMVFVGPKSQYSPSPEQENNVLLKAKKGNQGPVVTLEVLEWLKSENKFKAF